jgi:hypothetical protein
VRRRWATAGIGVLLLLTVAWFIGRSVGPGTKLRFPSSYAPEPEGLLGFRMLLEQTDVPTAVVGRPWDEALNEEVAGVLVVATPLQRLPDRQETEGLRRWLRAGGTLLVVDDATALESSVELLSLLVDLGLGAELPITDLDEQVLAPARPANLPARGTPARPSDPAWREILLNTGAVFKDSARAIPLAIDGDGAVLAGEVHFDAGRAVRVMGPLLANDRILRGDNLAFALALVEDLRNEGSVLFDEYHHGFGGLFHVRRLDRAVLFWGLLQLLCVTIVFGVARGVRFGPVRPERRPQRRSSLEFVHSMASLYRRARARKHVVDGTWRRFVRKARSRWGLAESLPTEQLAQTIARLGDVRAEDVSRILGATRRVLDGDEQITEAAMVARVRELARLEEESFR